MANRPATFREADVTRAIRGALKAGLKVTGVEIDAAGRIVVFSGDAATEASARDSWSDVR